MVLNVISAYAPQVGLDESAKRQFWEDLDGLIRAVPSSEKLFTGDLNGHIGTMSCVGGCTPGAGAPATDAGRPSARPRRGTRPVRPIRHVVARRPQLESYQDQFPYYY